MNDDYDYIAFLILALGVLLLTSCSVPSPPDPIDAAIARQIDRENPAP